MALPVLIAVDWGTTSCRATRLAANGQPVDNLEGGPGILAVRDAAFEPALTSFLSPWLSSADRLPIILSGMIGSRQGWREAAYLRCPASLSDIAAHLHWIDSPSFGRIALVPGLDDHATGTPDVMRGEETQIFGALGTGSGICVLPGTHSKWATVTQGRIMSFRSYMTGEVFAALKEHTILGRLMTPSVPPAPTAATTEAFQRGVLAGAAPGAPGALLNRIFATRTLGLFDQLPASSLADYLSGVLIGAEIADNVRTANTAVTIIASPALTERYRIACAALAIATTTAASDSAARGAFAIARSAGLLPGT